MPTWLVHGFRWPRLAIRIHIILENLEDCATEWLMAPATTAQLTESFKSKYPEQLAHLPSLRFIEQYDPADEYTKDQPYAYVCDQVTEIKLGVDVDDIRGVGVQSEAWTALVELRDKVAPEAKVGWFIVVNGDVERRVSSSIHEDEQIAGTDSSLDANGYEAEVSPISPVSQPSTAAKSSEDDAAVKKKGLRKWIGIIRKARSIKDLKATDSSPIPPLPPIPPTAQSLPNPKRATSGSMPASAGTA